MSAPEGQPSTSGKPPHRPLSRGLRLWSGFIVLFCFAGIIVTVAGTGGWTSILFYIGMGLSGAIGMLGVRGWPMIVLGVAGFLCVLASIVGIIVGQSR
jgi:hypothetical protein